jgi:hypothetical protein
MADLTAGIDAVAKKHLSYNGDSPFVQSAVSSLYGISIKLLLLNEQVLRATL